MDRKPGGTLSSRGPWLDMFKFLPKGRKLDVWGVSLLIFIAPDCAGADLWPASTSRDLSFSNGFLNRIRGWLCGSNRDGFGGGRRTGYDSGGLAARLRASTALLESGLKDRCDGPSWLRFGRSKSFWTSWVVS